MPARRDIDPADIPALLPHVSLIHKPDGQFRFRLVGSAAVEQFGRDLTGDVVGSHVGNAPETVAATQAVCGRVFATARPVFSPGHYETRPGLIYHGSVLLLPLSDDGMRVNMIIFMRIVCFFDLKGCRPPFGRGGGARSAAAPCWPAVLCSTSAYQHVFKSETLQSRGVRL